MNNEKHRGSLLKKKTSIIFSKGEVLVHSWVLVVGRSIIIITLVFQAKICLISYPHTRVVARWSCAATSTQNPPNPFTTRWWTMKLSACPAPTALAMITRNPSIRHGKYGRRERWDGNFGCFWWDQRKKYKETKMNWTQGLVIILLRGALFLYK